MVSQYSQDPFVIVLRGLYFTFVGPSRFLSVQKGLLDKEPDSLDRFLLTCPRQDPSIAFHRRVLVTTI